jgi:hypothetical protein
LIFVSGYAKNMPGVQTKLQARKFKKIARVWPLAASGLAEYAGEMTKSVWVYAQIDSRGAGLVCDSASVVLFWWRELYLAQTQGGW